MYWIYRNPQAEYYTQLAVQRAVASLERAMVESSCDGAVTTDYVLIHLPGPEASILPSFRGRFQHEQGVTILSGHFEPARRAQLLFSFWVGAAFGLAALSGALAGPQFVTLFLAVAASATLSLMRATSQAMKRGMAFTGKLIEGAFQPLASPSLVLVASRRQRKPAA
jgi:hypothetical protein